MFARSLPRSSYSLGITALAIVAILWRPPVLTPSALEWATIVALLLLVGAACWLAPAATPAAAVETAGGVGVFVSLIGALVLDSPAFAALAVATVAVE